MTTAPKTQRRSGLGIRRLAAAAAVVGMAVTGAAAVGVPAFAADARPAAAAEAYSAPEAVEPVAIETVVPPAAPSERGVPGVGLSIFFGTALTLGAGSIVTARLLAHRHHRSIPVRSES